MTLLPESDHEAIKLRILKHPELIEPGLLLKADDMALPNGFSIPVHGMDMLGRPCLVGIFQEMCAEVYEWVLQAAVAFRDGIQGSDPVYSCGREPRLFLLCQQFKSADHACLRLLEEAVSIRVYQLESKFSPKNVDMVSWNLQLAFPAPDPMQQRPWWLDLDPKHQSCISRLLAAANCHEPKISVLGKPWPILFSGVDGPFAALHQSEKGLFMVVEGSGLAQSRILDLSLASDQDHAVDCILRNRKTEPKLFVTH